MERLQREEKEGRDLKEALLPKPPAVLSLYSSVSLSLALSLFCPILSATHFSSSCFTSSELSPVHLQYISYQ